MYTDAAAVIAEKRHVLLEQFVNALENEIGSGPTSSAEPLVQSGKDTRSP
jgi:hypothetical protein